VKAPIQRLLCEAGLRIGLALNFMGLASLGLDIDGRHPYVL
jgi:hypothetical protein